jgi:uncharacterized membrane protein
MTTTGDDEEMPKRILLAGETWISHKIDVKGFSSYSTGSFGEGQTELVEALEKHGHEVVHIPTSPSRSFPGPAPNCPPTTS